MNKIELKICISEEVFKKLKEQLITSQNSKTFITENKNFNVNTVEDLIEYYLFQITDANEEINKIHSKMSDVISTLNEKGVNFSEIMNMFKNTTEKKEKEEEEKKEENKESTNKTADWYKKN